MWVDWCCDSSPARVFATDLATGERADLFTITGTGSVHDGLEMAIRDIALAPGWLKVNE